MMVRYLASYLLLLVFAAGAGCSRHPQLKKTHTVPVRGRVLLDGRPITFGNGSVSFVRQDSEVAGPSNLRVSGLIDEMGNYELVTHLALDYDVTGFFAMKPGAPPGRYRVEVHVREGASPDRRTGEFKRLIPDRYARSKTSGIVIDVVDEPAAGAYDLHLNN
jgi:hypothetical protein